MVEPGAELPLDPFAAAQAVAVAWTGRRLDVQAGDAHEIYEHPRSRLVAGFIGIANVFPAEDGRGWLALRPEKIQILSKQPPDAAENCLVGSVLDIAYLGPVTYILQSRRAKLEPFARPSHAVVGPTFQAVIIVPKDSPARTLKDLKGKEIAFGDPASTSGTWVPRYQLLEAGLVSERDYTLRVLGAHDAVALAVANHKVAAGGLSMPIYNRLLKEGKIDANAVRVLAESAPIPEYMWTFREGLPPAFKEEVRKAFTQVDDPAALAVFRAEAFIPGVDADVDRVRAWIEAIRKETPSAVPAP